MFYFQQKHFQISFQLKSNIVLLANAAVMRNKSCSSVMGMPLLKCSFLRICGLYRDNNPYGDAIVEMFFP